MHSENLFWREIAYLHVNFQSVNNFSSSVPKSRHWQIILLINFMLKLFYLNLRLAEKSREAIRWVRSDRLKLIFCSTDIQWISNVRTSFPSVSMWWTKDIWNFKLINKNRLWFRQRKLWSLGSTSGNRMALRKCSFVWRWSASNYIGRPFSWRRQRHVDSRLVVSILR